MADGFSVSIDIDASSIDSVINKFNEVINNEQFKLAVHNALAKWCDPYVPMDEGVLSQSIEIMPDYVHYTQPYAHYQYIGEVYGPNIPIIENGVIVGWFSPPGKGSKHPTGRQISYNVEKHPLATDHWDKAMMRDRGDEFKKEIADLIIAFVGRLNDG